MNKKKSEQHSPQEWVAVLDFGSQYTQLIPRRVRELKVYSEIVPHDISAEELLRRRPKAMILSGGPAGVGEGRSPRPALASSTWISPHSASATGCSSWRTQRAAPWCRATSREYRQRALLTIEERRRNVHGAYPRTPSMEIGHGDPSRKLPEGFRRPGLEPGLRHRGDVRRASGRLVSMQLHPEVVHTDLGCRDACSNFLVAGSQAGRVFLDSRARSWSRRRPSCGKKIYPTIE